MKPGSAMPVTLCSVAALFVAVGFGPASAQEVVVSFADDTNTDSGVWFESDLRGAGTATIVDLTGEGGNLESNQPLPNGAAMLTTGTDNNDKAEVGVGDDYGKAGDILSTLELYYDYYKATNTGVNPEAAPSIKLSFYSEACLDPGGDCFGTLVYEPYWNQPGFEGSSRPVPADVWTSVAIEADTGLFWWTGGFGEPNSFGGPPLRTLDEWLSVFSEDFDAADLVLVSIGVGTYNREQISYVDDVEIRHEFDAGYDAWYDFEPPIGPPTDKRQCKRGGWRDFNNPVFANQGECVRYVVLNGNPKYKDHHKPKRGKKSWHHQKPKHHSVRQHW